MGRLFGDSGDPSSMTRAEFAAELARMRSLSRYTFRDLARELDSTPATLSGWMKGKHLPYPRYDEMFEHLLRLLGVDDHRPWMEALARLRSNGNQTSNPYAGLEPFDADSREFYFGRRVERDRLADLIARRGRGSPTVVVGPSGAGKTSLVRVVLPEIVDSEVVFLTADSLDTNEARIDESGVPGAVVIDQCERLFIHDDPAAGLRVISEIVDAVDTVVLVLRADHYHRAVEHEPFAAALSGEHLYVGSISPEDVAAIVRGPAERVGRKVGPALVARLVADFSSGRTASGIEALPLLSHVLFELADRTSGELRLVDYERIGGLVGAIEATAEGVYGELGEPEQLACEWVFDRLFDLGPDGAATRRIVGYDRVADSSHGGHGVVLDRVVDAFLAGRILTIDEQGLAISHEAVLEAWPRLAAWVDDASADVIAASRVRNARRAWVADGRDPAALLRGAGLVTAEAAAENVHGIERLDGDDIKFVRASRAAVDAAAGAEVSRLRRFRTLAMVAVIAAVLALAFGVRSRDSEQRAEASERAAGSRELALLASTLNDSAPGLAGQVALVAHGQSPTPQASSRLIDLASRVPMARFLGNPTTVAIATSRDGRLAAYSDPVEAEINLVQRGDAGWESAGTADGFGEETDIYGAALSPEGSLLAAGGTNGTIDVWSLSDVSEPVRLDPGTAEFAQPVQSVAFSPDGSHVFAGGTGEGVVHWEVDGDDVTTLPVIPETETVYGLTVSPDGTRLAMALADGTVRLVDLATGDNVIELPGDAVASSVALSPDGRYLAAGYRSTAFRLWDLIDVESGAGPVEVSPPDQGFTTWVNTVDFSPDGALVAAGSADSSLRVWRVADRTVAGPVLEHPANVLQARFVDDRTLAATSLDGSMRIWDLSDAAFNSLNSGVWESVFTNDGEYFATSSRRIGLWEPAGETYRPHEEVALLDDATGEGLSISSEGTIHPDGSAVWLGGRSGSVYHFDAAGLYELDVPSDVAAAAEEMLGPTALVEQVVVSPDLSLVAAGADDSTVTIWRSDSLDEPAATIELSWIATSVAFSPDSQMLVVALDSGAVHLFDVSDPTNPVELAELQPAESTVYTVTFHPTEPIIAAGADTARVYMYDVSDPAEPTLIGEPLVGAYSRIYTVAFSLDGERLAASSGAGVLVWDVTDPAVPKEELKLSPTQSVYSVAFSPDGGHLIGGDSNGQVHFWNLDVDQAIADICNSIGTPITEEEWTRLIGEEPYNPPCA